MAEDSKKPNAYAEFKAAKIGALTYDHIYERRESGEISPEQLKDSAAKIAPDKDIQSYLMHKDTPIAETYPFIEAGSKMLNRQSAQMGVDNLEKIIDSTPKANLNQGLGVLSPDPAKVNKPYEVVAEYHKKLRDMQKVFITYQDQDAEDEVREKATKKIVDKIKSFYNEYLKDDEPEVQGVVQWLIENSQLFAPNKYTILMEENRNEFIKGIKGKEKDYIKAIISTDEENRERFYQAIIQDPPKKENQQQQE